MVKKKYNYPENLEELLHTKSVVELSKELHIPLNTLYAHIYFLHRCSLDFCYDGGNRTHKIKIRQLPSQIWLCSWHFELLRRFGAEEWLRRFEVHIRKDNKKDGNKRGAYYHMDKLPDEVYFEQDMSEKEGA